MASKPTPQPSPAKAKPSAPDPVVVDSKHYKVELENERVRVLRIKYGPHEKSAMHSHPALIAVFVTDGHSRFTYPDGKTEDVKAKAGQVMYFPALDHLPENLSDKIRRTASDRIAQNVPRTASTGGDSGDCQSS